MKRYKALLRLHDAFIHFEREDINLIISQPNITSKEELLNELNSEWINMLLYACDHVILKIKSVLEIETKNQYYVI